MAVAIARFQEKWEEKWVSFFVAILFRSQVSFFVAKKSGCPFSWHAFSWHGVREAAFTVVSLVTSTGFATVDHVHWPDFLPVLLLLLAFVGGCGGSTAGGMKVMRAMLLAKQGFYEVRRLIHPRAMTKLRIGRRVVDAQLMQSVWGYFALYMITFVICGL
ncbi:MAG: hypothetical protein N838_34025 [Thiohalocapsa sp. PB-PSB1]|jgi:Trk-type K+ transport system membrane component|nr:MAG: hypothetical protein N838_34025 [Thiohalocapsa sp. PB-PSB1]